MTNPDGLLILHQKVAPPLDKGCQKSWRTEPTPAKTMPHMPNHPTSNQQNGFNEVLIHL